VGFRAPQQLSAHNQIGLINPVYCCRCIVAYVAVLTPAFEPITRLMFQTNYSTLHYNIHDIKGRSMVIEYSGPNNLQVRAEAFEFESRRVQGLGVAQSERATKGYGFTSLCKPTAAGIGNACALCPTLAVDTVVSLLRWLPLPAVLQWHDSTNYAGALANNRLWAEQTAYYNSEWQMVPPGRFPFCGSAASG
jgi:hypothetical protein